MPLSEKVRIEAYLPDLPRPAYQELLTALELEFTHTFGGCTTARGLEGNYLSRAGAQVRDRINLVYSDAPLSFNKHFNQVATYADELRRAAHDALEEEAILVAVVSVHHSE